jgi:ADP-heptose:LPS heptosyltransferase
MDQKITPKIKMLVIRISAMGDVALTVPPLNRIIKNNPELEITFISKPPYGCFFWGIPRFKFYPVQFNNYRGILGLQKLSNEIFYSEKFDLVIDLHGSLRSRIMCWFAQWRGIPSFRINKGRSEKKLATRKTNL